MYPLAILLVRSWYVYHAANLTVPRKIGGKYTQQPFGVETIGLRSFCPPVHQNACWLYHVRWNIMRRQQPVQPEPVTPCLEASRDGCSNPLRLLARLQSAQ
jgi:hypothetical protein